MACFALISVISVAHLYCAQWMAIVQHELIGSHLNCNGRGSLRTAENPPFFKTLIFSMCNLPNMSKKAGC